MQIKSSPTQIKLGKTHTKQVMHHFTFYLGVYLVYCEEGYEGQLHTLMIAEYFMGAFLKFIH